MKKRESGFLTGRASLLAFVGLLAAAIIGGMAIAAPPASDSLCGAPTNVRISRGDGVIHDSLIYPGSDCQDTLPVRYCFEGSTILGCIRLDPEELSAVEERLGVSSAGSGDLCAAPSLLRISRKGGGGHDVLIYPGANCDEVLPVRYCFDGSSTRACVRMSEEEVLAIEAR